MEKSTVSIKVKKSTLFVFKSKKGKEKHTSTDPTNTTGMTQTTDIFGVL